MKNQKTDKDQIPYRNKFNGYRCSHRNRWLLIANKTMAIQPLILFELYIDISDFDQKHTTYGTFKVNYSKLARLFDCSENTIRNWHNVLIKLQLITPTEERQIFSLTNLERYIAPGFWKGQASGYAKEEKNQPVESVLQYMSGSIQLSEKNTKPVAGNSTKSLKENATKALGLSKYPSKVGISSKELTREDKDWLDRDY